MSEGQETRLGIKDYLAFIIALLTTHLLPLLILAAIVILVAAILGYIFR